MRAGVLAPFYRGFPLCEHIRIFHLVSCLGFQHADGILSFGDEVRLVFQVIGARPVKYLKRVLRRPKPPLRFAVENDREDALRLGMEFLNWVEASLEAVEKILRHVGFVGR
jgi:hypothetical protein